MTVDVQIMRKRLILMLAVDAVCAVIAIGAAVGAYMMHHAWMQWLFLGAVGAGFAAQIWFIAGFRRAKNGV